MRIAVICTIVGLAFAAAADTVLLTLDECIDLALTQNTDVRLA